MKCGGCGNALLGVVEAPTPWALVRFEPVFEPTATGRIAEMFFVTILTCPFCGGVQLNQKMPDALKEEMARTYLLDGPAGSGLPP